MCEYFDIILLHLYTLQLAKNVTNYLVMLNALSKLSF